MLILLQLLSSFALFICISAQFSPDTSDYNAYGLKMAANNMMMVEAQNDFSLFLVQIAPYTDNITQNEQNGCYLDYNDPSQSQYIYSVALGENQTKYIFYVGETLDLNEDDEVENRTFVGVIEYTGTSPTIDCDNDFIVSPPQYVANAFVHQEHLVIVTDPVGLVAYGFSNLFTFSYIASANQLTVYPNNSLSLPKSFFPYAVDYDGNYGIVAGFVDNGQNSPGARFSATVFLFSINASTAIATPVDTWTYPTNSTAWQAGLSNVGADGNDPKFAMSVNINPMAAQVLVGIQTMNAVFFFSYTPTTLTLVTTLDNSRGIGFGKGVAWLSDTVNSVAILANVYSSAYVWSSSKIYIYDSPLTSNSTPATIFPNIQQQLYTVMSTVFLNIITTPTHLVLLDDQGNLFVILSAPSGYYSSTTGPDVEIVPAFSTQLPCIAGTYKNVTGIRPCRPCPTGTKNDGTNPTMAICADCATNAFCPLGATSDSISNDQLSNVTQALAYPKSPDITGLDDILFFTLFSIGSSGRCVVLSPIFWTLIVAAIVIIITLVMVVIKYSLKSQKAKNSYKTFEKVFKGTDLIREGEMWSGGLATFCALVLCIACCVFSAQYYASYPIETVGPSTYTCDTTIRNAQFTTALQSLSVPVDNNTQSMLDLLNNQAVNLDVSFINTIYTCTDEVTLNYQLGSTWLPVTPNPSCSSSSSTVSYSALLPFRIITVQFTLPNIYNIGGLRVGLSAPGQNQSSTIMLQSLAFSQTFNQSGRMLGQNAYISLELTKVVNDTSPLVSGNDDVFSGIWIGSFTVNYYESFMTDTDYLKASPQASTILTIVISEAPYFILNSQSPIASLPIIIYHDFLFITMIIGMFVLIFVIIEVLILPCCKNLIRRCRSKPGDKYKTDGSDRSSSSHADDLENPPSNSNKQGHTEPKLDIAVVNNVALQKQTFASNQYTHENEYDKQQLPPMWNRQAYL